MKLEPQQEESSQDLWSYLGQVSTVHTTNTYWHSRSKYSIMHLIVLRFLSMVPSRAGVCWVLVSAYSLFVGEGSTTTQGASLIQELEMSGRGHVSPIHSLGSYPHGSPTIHSSSLYRIVPFEFVQHSQECQFTASRSRSQTKSFYRWLRLESWNYAAITSTNWQQ